MLASVASCEHGHILVDKPTKLRGDDWVLTVRRVKNGPDDYNGPNTVYRPAKGERFVWVYLSLHNLQHVRRKFNFDRCDLDAGDKIYVPTLVDADDFGPILVGREAELGGNEALDRLLIFAYPEERAPTRLSCAPMVMPLPQF